MNLGNKFSNVKKQYPIVLNPDFYEMVLQSEISVPEPPKEPELPRRQDGNFGGITIAGVFVVIIEAMFRTPIAAIIITLIVFLIWDFFYWIVNSEKNSNVYTERMREYNIQKEKYGNELVKHNKLVKKLRNSTDTSKYRKRLLMEKIKSTSRPREKIQNTNRGTSELFFLKILLKWFPDRIFTNYIINKFDSNRAYQPDFIFQDSKTNLHIDIEIDEPYVLNSLKPIHYIENGLHIDISRDEYFTSKGWAVIRFSEEQIVKYPNECCQLIAENIYNFTGLDFRKKDISLLPKVECWDIETSLNYVTKKYREKYLKNIDFISSENYISEINKIEKNLGNPKIDKNLADELPF